MLYTLITNAGFTQMQVAERLGVRQQTVSKWCNGKSTPALSIMTKLADVLKVDVQDIINCFIDETEKNKEE